MGMNVVWGLVVVAVLAVAGLWAFQRWGIYRFDRTVETPADLPRLATEAGIAADGAERIREATVTAADGTPLTVWIAEPAPGKPVLISFFGNFTTIGKSARRYLPLVAEGYGLAMPKYRGAGGAPGQPSEAAFGADAVALYDALDTLMGQTVPADVRVIHGYSLGTGVAVQLAQAREARALVLEASYHRLCAFWAKKYRVIPLCSLQWAERYDSAARIGAVTMPILLAHGAQDGALPIAWARALEAEATAPTRFITYPEGGHADLPAHGFLDDLRSVLDGGLPGAG